MFGLKKQDKDHGERRHHERKTYEGDPDVRSTVNRARDVVSKSAAWRERLRREIAENGVDAALKKMVEVSDVG